jgi:hypothetical protein
MMLPSPEMTWTRDQGSFRDPSGFVFVRDGRIYRQINQGYEQPYVLLRSSGLFDELTAERLLVPSDEVDLRLEHAPAAFAVLAPEPIPFISYPFEWCFSQLKAAALLTLDLQRRAIERGLVLRDASAYNVQFVGARPIFIDTLSFGVLAPGEPWVAYRQFCQHFLAPLALVAGVDPALGQLSRTHLDGVPLDLASRLLPARLRWRPGVLMHLGMHARAAASGRDQHRGAVTRSPGKVGRAALLGLVDSLRRTVQSQRWEPPDTLWSTYRDHTNYSPQGDAHKRRLVSEAVQQICGTLRQPTVWDIGANDGVYSRLAADAGARVISLDLDPAIVEHHARQCAADASSTILPLVQDLTNPTPAFGWRHTERRSLLERGPSDLALALALVHHLVIGGGVPLDEVAAFFHAACRHLIIEFVPKSDSQVARMLALREDTFADYSQGGFEQAFDRRFERVSTARIDDSERTLYVLKRRP